MNKRYTVKNQCPGQFIIYENYGASTKLSLERKLNQGVTGKERNDVIMEFVKIAQHWGINIDELEEITIEYLKENNEHIYKEIR